ncbi:hypothetical protein VNO77_23745 [Canavalia gladiata]|uniref:Transmembrane protein n=1 Tax=Canavalia gladiata TaxID=3824 RepID=A0AAN9L4Y9_CANGL
MKEHQTPQKITFTSVSEDSVDLSPISGISDANRNEDVTAFCTVWIGEASTVSNDLYMFQTFFEEPSSVTTLLPSDMTPKNITDITGIGSTNCFGSFDLDSSKFASVEEEIAVNFLRNVKHEVLNSINKAPRYRKLMDVIIEYVIHDFHSGTTLLEEKDHFAHVLSMKNHMLLLCTFIWIVGVLVVLFFTTDVRSPYIAPLPT